MTPEEAVDDLVNAAKSLDRTRDSVVKATREYWFNAARARVLAMMRQDPADTAASALADVQAIREQQRRLESRSYGANERIDGACMRIASLERGHGEYGGTVAEIWLKIAALEQANRDAYESYKLLRDRVAALEGKS